MHIDHVIQLIQKLRSQIQYHNKLYYQDSSPIISDAEYDALKKQLRDTISIHKAELETRSISTEEDVGYKPARKKFFTIQHDSPMLSLDNAFNQNDIVAFIERVKKNLNEQSAVLEFACQEKIDGVSFSAVYNNGNLIYAATRGDGLEGENITKNFKTIQNVPIQIQHNAKIEVRGEIYIEKEDFEKMNRELEQLGQKTFANPRNAASGSIRQSNSDITAGRPLKYQVWDVIAEGGETHSELLELAKNLHFDVIKTFRTKNIDDIFTYYDNIAKNRYDIKYDIDGIVCKLNEKKHQYALSNTSSAPKWAIAYKFSAQTAETMIKDITVQISRHGTITPVAKLEPINVGGVVISKATLHNFDEIERLDCRIEDRVTIKRSGDVIPKIIAVSQKAKDSKRYMPPSLCPSCSHPVVRDSAFYQCSNKNTCPEQIIQSFIHFVSKGCFDISGLGEKQLRQLYDLQIVRTLYDILNLPSRHDHIVSLKNTKGWGDKSVDELLKSINQSKTISMPRFLHSLNIKHLGIIAAEKISDRFQNIEELMNAAKDTNTDYLFNELMKIQGIGEKIAYSFCDYMHAEYHTITQILPLLSVQDRSNAKNNSVINTAFSNKTIAFTGILAEMSRAEAAEIASAMGAVVKKDVSKTLDILVYGEKAGSKLKLAKQMSIQLMNNEEFLQAVNRFKN